jgi:heme exporter protein B
VSLARQIVLLYRKDLRMEVRKKESLVAMAFFGVLIMVILNLAAGLGGRVEAEPAAGILWVAILFSAVLGLGRVFAREKENGCVAALMVSPLSPGALFTAKALVNFTLMCCSELVLVPVFLALYGGRLEPDPLGLLVLLALVNLGFSAVGTLLSALAAGTRRNEVLLPILLYPLSLPLVAFAVKATGTVFAGRPLLEIIDQLEPMAAFGLIYAVAGYLLFAHAVREV